MSEKSRSALSRRSRAAVLTLCAVLLSLGLFNIGTTAAQVQQVKEKPGKQRVEVKPSVLEVGEKLYRPDVADGARSKPDAPQNCEAIMEKLKRAVAAGTISEEEAKGTMIKCVPKEKDSVDERKIKLAIEAGLITPEEGKKQLSQVSEKQLALMQNNIILRAEQDIRSAVEAGLITKEQGKEKLDKVMGMERAVDKTKVDCEKIVRAIADALSAGVITVEQAREKLAVACVK